MPLKLPDLQGFPIAGPDGRPTPYFERLWSEMKSRLESEVGALQAAEAAQAAADAADAAAAAADAAAAAAQAAADDTASATAANARFLAISNSSTTGLTITATDAGTDVTVTFSAHTRHYADGTSVAVNGGSITGLAYSTQYFFSYDDADLSGGAQTYVAHTSGPDAQTTGPGTANEDTHYVGSVVTPAAAAPATTGAQPVSVTFDRPVGGDWL